jgi:MFS family permease
VSVVRFAVGARGRLGLFGQDPFAVYWTGGFLSNVGTWLQAVAGSVFVYDRTGSAFAVGVLNFATFLPILLFSVPGGVISDRLDRRAIVVVTQVISGVLGLGLAILTFAGGATEFHVIAIAFALQTSWAIAKPALTAMLPALVTREELTQAVGLNTLQFMTGQLVGPLIATLVLATGGYAWAFGINAATFIAPIVAMAYLYRRGLAGSVDPGAAGASPQRRQSITSYIRSQPWIAFVLIAVVTTSAVTEVIRTTAPVLVTERLRAPSSDAGLIIAAQSFGYVCGILAFTLLRRRDLARPIAAFGLVLQGCGLLIASAATEMPVAAVGVAAIGMGFALCLPVVTAVLQAEVPDHIRGRLMSYHQIALLGNRPFTALAAGALAATFGVPVACLAATVLVPIGLLACRAAWRSLGAQSTAVSAQVTL